ncbi:MAG: anti-sigma factor [Rhizobiaceae bacterium]|nr:anti-sigma factor [Rhizobiaceae bacterium]
MTARDYSVRDIHLSLDGELPADERADFDHWLDANPDMKALSARYEADRDRLAAALADVAEEAVPERLASLLAGGGQASRRRAAWWQAAAAALLLAVGAAGGYMAGLAGLGFDRAGEDLAAQAIAAHRTFTPATDHVVEVAANGDGYLKTWLSSQVGLTLVLPDLTGEGYELLGGRIIPAEDGPAALLVYQNSKGDRISIYMTAASTTKARGLYGEHEGTTKAIYWLDPGYGCAVVSDLPEDQMRPVARDAWRQMVDGLNL